MTITCDCHCHTVASGHAYSTVGEYMAEAARKGLELVAITDHGPQMPGGPHLWHFHNLRVLPRFWGPVELWRGVEANVVDLDGTLDLADEDLAALDLVVASFHSPFFPSSTSRADLTQAARRVLENPRVTILGHPDDDRLPLDHGEIARVAADTGTWLEVNNSSLLPGGHRKGARENYLRMLDACVKFGTRVVLDSDAHVHLDVGRCDASGALLETVGFPEELVVNTSAARLKAWAAEVTGGARPSRS
jgi:putative hydrolase